MKSIAGIIEGFMINPGFAGPFVMGQSLPSTVSAIPCGIAGPKDLMTEDYNPPRDAFNNILRNKKNFKFSFNTFESDLRRLAWYLFFNKLGGCDVILISEGFSEYEGNINGIEEESGGTWWRRNPDNGIFIFSHLVKSGLGLDWEFLLEDNNASIQTNLEAALNYGRARTIMQNAATNIVNKSINLPQWFPQNQNVTETKKIEIIRGAGYSNVFTWDEVESRRLSLKSTIFKKAKDNRNLSSYVDVNLEIQGSNASVQNVNQLWNDNLFAGVRLTEELPNGTEIVYLILPSTLSNRSDLNANKENRLATFRIEGQVSIRRVVVAPSLTLVTIG